MKVLIICSRAFYSRIPEIVSRIGREIELFYPDYYHEPTLEDIMLDFGMETHQILKSKIYKKSENAISNMDAILVLNFDKNKNGKILKNHISEEAFLKISDAFKMNKKIYLYNDMPEGILFVQLQRFNLIVLNGNLKEIKPTEEKKLVKVLK